VSGAIVRVGMLGAGFIGQMHSLAFRLAGYARQEPTVRAEFVALADYDMELRESVAARYGWASHLSDWDDLLDEDLELFINAGPNDVHVEPALRAAAKGMFVFSEKPLAATAEEAYQLWKGVTAHGVGNRCAFMQRFIPAVQLAKAMVDAGDLGEVRQFRSQFLLDMVGAAGDLPWRFDRTRAGLGALGDLGSHHVDLARFIVGSEIVRVTGVTRTWSADPRGAMEHVNDDAFACVAELENGAIAVFEACRVANAHRLTGRFEVDGTRGSVSFDMERLNELMIRQPRQGPTTVMVTRMGDPFDGFWLPSGIQGSHPLGWTECFGYQAHAILGLASGLVEESAAATFEDGYRVAEIVDTIDRAAREGAARAVEFRA